MGLSLREIVTGVGGGVREGHTLKAVQVGGPSGLLIGPDEFRRTLGYEDLGTGGSIVIFHDSRDLLREGYPQAGCH